VLLTDLSDFFDNRIGDHIQSSSSIDNLFHVTDCMDLRLIRQEKCTRDIRGVRYCSQVFLQGVMSIGSFIQLIFTCILVLLGDSAVV
jgi:hypothetical protein